MTDTFIREIPIEKITDKVVEDYERRGLKLVYKEESVEVWAVDSEG